MVENGTGAGKMKAPTEMQLRAISQGHDDALKFRRLALKSTSHSTTQTEHRRGLARAGAALA